MIVINYIIKALHKPILTFWRIQDANLILTCTEFKDALFKNLETEYVICFSIKENDRLENAV